MGSMPDENEELSQDPVLKGFQGILIVGRIIGVIPHSNLFSSSKYQIRRASFPFLHSTLLTLCIFGIWLCNLYLCVEKLSSDHGEKINETLSLLESPIYAFSVLFLFAFFVANGERLINILDTWTQVTTNLGLSSVDTNFPKFCCGITAMILSVGFTENLLYHNFVLRQSNGKLTSFVETILPGEGIPLPHTPLAAMICLYLTKMGAYAWNFGDIFAIVCCRAVTYKFEQLNQDIRNQLEDRDKLEDALVFPSLFQSKISKHFGKLEHYDKAFGFIQFIDASFEQRKELFWRGVGAKIFALSDLAEQMANFVGPLVMTCFGCNIYLIIFHSLKLVYGQPQAYPLYMGVSSFQFVMRVILVTYYTAQVHHSVEDIVKTLERCPDSQYSTKVTFIIISQCPTFIVSARLEAYLKGYPVGVTIFGVMRVTRKLFISILSFLFTVEIVLIQAINAASSKPSKSYLD